MNVTSETGCVMESIEIESAKISKMREFIEKRMQQLSAIEEAEFVKRRSQYYSASRRRMDCLKKKRELNESVRQAAKLREKQIGIGFLVILSAALANKYLDWFSAAEYSSIGVALLAAYVIVAITNQIDEKSNQAKIETYDRDVESMLHEMRCVSNDLYITCEDEFYYKDDMEQEEKAVVNQLYFASVDIAILQGMKADAKHVWF